MKELSIEEKAYKAYTELINRLEDVKNAIKKQNYGIAMDILYKPYPEFQITTSTELKESEDERIRNNCIHFLDLQKSHHASTIEIDECIAWLEKKGEQKEDDPPFNDPKYLAGFDTGREVQKIFDEQKPTEWSEEDEELFEEIKRCVGIQYPLGNPCIFKFLKSIKGRYTWKPSKEQMKANELMIGDWVMVNDMEHTHPLQVAEIFKKSGAYYATLYWDGMPDNVNPETLTADVNKVLPIPLTPEILEKNGFVVLSRYFHGNPLQYCVLVDGLWIDISGENYFEGKLEYVHQLQHALKLCEIEKEIEL